MHSSRAVPKQSVGGDRGFISGVKALDEDMPGVSHLEDTRVPCPVCSAPMISRHSLRNHWKEKHPANWLSELTAAAEAIPEGSRAHVSF